MHIKTSNQEPFTLGVGDYTCNLGLHVAGLYETEQERDDIIMGFLSQGCKEGDLQLYCPAERTAEDFHEKMHHRCPHCNTHDRNYFQINSAKELYYPEGAFSPKQMDIGLNDFFTKSQENGKRTIRATAEMVWALDAIPGSELLMVYESRLNYFIAGKPWISICLYNVNKFSGATIMNVLRTHPFTINGGILTENPYFIDPDIWLKENYPAYLNI